MMFMLAGTCLLALVAAVRIGSLTKRVEVLEDRDIERLEGLERRVEQQTAR